MSVGKLNFPFPDINSKGKKQVEQWITIKVRGGEGQENGGVGKTKRILETETL